jgi:histone H3/H4
MMVEAGLDRLEEAVYQEVRALIQHFSQIIIKRIADVLYNNRKKTVTHEDVNYIVGLNIPGDVLYTGRLPFERYMREVMQDYKTDVRFSKDALIELQHTIESFVVDMAKAAKTHKGTRKTLRASDLVVVKDNVLARWDRFTAPGFTFDIDEEEDDEYNVE